MMHFVHFNTLLCFFNDGEVTDLKPAPGSDCLRCHFIALLFCVKNVKLVYVLKERITKTVRPIV